MVIDDSNQKSTSSLKVCFVQPIQSPYFTERLKSLALHDDLGLSLLLERDKFNHRPGWHSEAIEGVNVEVLGSKVVSSISKGDDLGYRIHGVRSIPWRLIGALWRQRPDIVIVCNATQLLLALPMKLFLKIRLALLVEDTPHATRNLGRFARWVKAWSYRRADLCFAFSDDARQFLCQIGIRQDIVRSSWSLDMDNFRPLRMESTQSNDSGITLKKVLFVGQLIPRKGILLLLNAWRSLPFFIRERSRLLILGEGPLRDEIKTFIQIHNISEVELIGQVTYVKVRDLMCSSDLFVLPTLQDLFSLTVLEAMACGCPVITTPYNGARELVEETVTGWVVNPIEEGALSATLLNALSGSVDLRAMGRAARSRVESMDNTKVMADFRLALLSHVRGNKTI